MGSSKHISSQHLNPYFDLTPSPLLEGEGSLHSNPSQPIDPKN
ncbi:hypothetical protein M595_2946 [Lyngbya aestuarii BL J]|uniref:Uncharacterized protein n=1 Tax=Lyngbya aestuarii BL J TaxID=1348334 RepID=U7QGN5_9CYAN|nr:hypothetical protein M595_2946 [Lyngbya aestuarii BL J]